MKSVEQIVALCGDDTSEAVRSAVVDTTAASKDPYPHGDLGVIKEGVYADILLIDVDPTQDIRLLMDSANVVLIMKDGKIYKNAL